MGLFGLVVEVGVAVGGFLRRHLRRAGFEGEVRESNLGQVQCGRPVGHMDGLSSKRLGLWVWHLGEMFGSRKPRRGLGRGRDSASRGERGGERASVESERQF